MFSDTNRPGIDESWPPIAGHCFYEAINGNMRELGRAASVHIWTMRCASVVPSGLMVHSFGAGKGQQTWVKYYAN